MRTTHRMEGNQTGAKPVPPNEDLHSFELFYVHVRIPGHSSPDERVAESDVTHHYVCITANEGRAVELVKMATDTFPGIKYTSSAAAMKLREPDDGIFVKCEQVFRIG